MTTARGMTDEVADAVADYPEPARRRLAWLRRLVLEVADETADVGGVTETLKWGEPAYVTPSGSGTTVRLDWKPRDPDHVGLYVSCRTSLVSDYRGLFPDDFAYDGDRAVLVPVDGDPDTAPLRTMIAMALRYHLDRRG